MLRRLALITALLSFTKTAPAADFDLTWHTIDGGGGTSAGAGPGGAFTLSGTIGQPDAQPVMSAGVLTLAGGFWPGLADVCTQPGDLNHDGAVDGDDVQGFVNCLLSAGTNCGCADIDGIAGVSPADVLPFVTALLGL